MEKIKILSLSKSENQNKYVFPKEQKFLTVINQILNEFGFEDYETGSLDFLDEKNEIKKYKDESYDLESKDFLINIIFGNEKIFLIINTQINKQKEISQVINKYTIM